MSSPQIELRRKGAEALQRADYPTAISALRSAVHADPVDVEALVLLGVACSQSGDHAGALQVLDRAAELAPMVANVQYNRALALERSGAADAAEWGLREVLRLDPSHQPARRKLEALSQPPEEAGAAAPVTAGGRPGQPDVTADLKRNLVRCPKCGAHTRRGRQCERCAKDLPEDLRLPPQDPAQINLPAPELGRPIGPVRLVFVGTEGVRVQTGGWIGPAVGAAGLVSLLGGGLALYLALTGVGEQMPVRLLAGAALLGIGGVALRLFHQLAALFRFQASRRIEASRFLGLSRAVWRADLFDGVHFAVEAAPGEGRESCWLRLETADRSAPIRLGPVAADESEAGELLRLGVLLARTLRLPLQVDGYPKNGAPELREALGQIG